MPTKCPNCGHTWIDARKRAGGRLRARNAARCETCGCMVRDGEHLCVKCAELEVLRDKAKELAEVRAAIPKPRADDSPYA